MTDGLREEERLEALSFFVAIAVWLAAPREVPAWSLMFSA
jgi:hypothetical protein